MFEDFGSIMFVTKRSNFVRKIRKSRRFINEIDKPTRFYDFATEITSYSRTIIELKSSYILTQKYVNEKSPRTTTCVGDFVAKGPRDQALFESRGSKSPRAYF